MLKETVEWCKPTRATKYSAMIDLYAKEDVVIGAGETKIVNLGVTIDKGNLKSYLEDYDDVQDFMLSHFIALHPRSSLRAKGLIVGVGVVDLDYVSNCKKGYNISCDTCAGFEPKDEE